MTRLLQMVVKGDQEYILTHYRKSKQGKGRRPSHGHPKLLVFGTDTSTRCASRSVQRFKAMKEEDLAMLQKFLRETADA